MVGFYDEGDVASGPTKMKYIISYLTRRKITGLIA
jgi:hypothetical protein